MQPSPPSQSRVAPFIALALVALAVVLSTRWVADSVASRTQKQRLERLPFQIDPSDRAGCEPIAAREGVIIARLDMQGATRFRTGSVPLAGASDGRTLDDADRQLPPWPGRDEVRAALAGNRSFGEYRTPDGAHVLTLAQPRPDGGVLYLVSGVVRGTVTRVVSRAIQIVAFASIAVALVVRWRTRRRDRRDGPPQ
jgi:hypothetical protein